MKWISFGLTYFGFVGKSVEKSRRRWYADKRNRASSPRRIIIAMMRGR